jgi:DNA (cytosine-5)-methyltransferase 1
MRKHASCSVLKESAGLRMAALSEFPRRAAPESRNRLKSREVKSKQLTYYEFFAGGGMARIGLGQAWTCSFANEWCEKKATAYRAFFGGSELRVCDVADLTAADLPGPATLAWASFPCQDLSLAGAGAGLNGKRSGTFRPFWELIHSLAESDRLPKLIVLENVTGTLTSHAGKDFNFIAGALAESGYRAGGMVLDAVHFLPHSRPRLFIVAAHSSLKIPARLALDGPSEKWHPRALSAAHDRLPEELKQAWVWWRLPAPTGEIAELASLIEDAPSGVDWHTKQQTERLISLMSPLHLEKLAAAQRLGKRIIGTVYRRTRPDENGARTQRAEIRFDQISGCLRTPVGGSSRQLIVEVNGRKVRSRLLSPREAARLMGVPDSYLVPGNYNEAYHLFGDGVAVPVVSWLEKHLLHPLALASEVEKAA